MRFSLSAFLCAIAATRGFRRLAVVILNPSKQKPQQVRLTQSENRRHLEMRPSRACFLLLGLPTSIVLVVRIDGQMRSQTKLWRTRLQIQRSCPKHINFDRNPQHRARTHVSGASPAQPGQIPSSPGRRVKLANHSRLSELLLRSVMELWIATPGLAQALGSRL